MTATHAAEPAAFPSKPVRTVVPIAPGGSTDYLGRPLAQKFGERVPQPVVVDNRPGAGGNIGTDVVAKAPPDGYTVVAAAPQIQSDKLHAIDVTSRARWPLLPDVPTVAESDKWAAVASNKRASLRSLLNGKGVRPLFLGSSRGAAGSRPKSAAPTPLPVAVSPKS